MALSEQNIEKAAAMLTCLGEQVAHEVLAHLSRDDMQILLPHLQNPAQISMHNREGLIEEFKARYFSQGNFGSREKYSTEHQMASTKGVKAQKPFDSLQHIDANRLLEILTNEPPNIISLVLYYIPREIAAQILAGLTDHVRHEVVMRLANLQVPNSQIVARLEQQLAEKLAHAPEDDETAERDLGEVTGARTLVEILGCVNPSVEQEVYELLQERDPVLAEEVRKQMFVFEDISKLDQRNLQIVLREMTAQDLALAIKGVSQELRNLVFGNVSENFSKAIQEEVELLGPVRVSLVEEAQQKIAASVRRLVEEGSITMRRAEENEILI